MSMSERPLPTSAAAKQGQIGQPPVNRSSCIEICQNASVSEIFRWSTRLDDPAFGEFLLFLEVVFRFSSPSTRQIDRSHGPQNKTPHDRHLCFLSITLRTDTPTSRWLLNNLFQFIQICQICTPVSEHR